MRSRPLQSPLAAVFLRRAQSAMTVASGAAIVVFLLLGESAHALEPGTRQNDTANIYKNVGSYMFTVGPTVPSYGSGVLIHPRVFMTAAHGTGWNVRSVAPFLRMVVSFSNDNPRDPSTWIDIAAHLTHPTYPWQDCVITSPSYPGECPPWASNNDLFLQATLVDIGLAVLARPVTNIVPATLARANDLANTEGQRMTFVGYGCVRLGDFVRNFGTGTVNRLSAQAVWYNPDPALTCDGDSGGPTFYNDRVVTVMSTGDGNLSYRFRVDRPIVLDWIASVIDSVSDIVDAVEFYNPALDHYFLSWVPEEISILDEGVTIKGWTRTGQRIPVYNAAKASTSPVCRFYLPPAFGDSHFYGRGSVECADTASKNPGFTLEDPEFMHMVLPIAGTCPENTTTTKKVFRVFSNRTDTNHRYMIDPTIRDQMVAKGWLAEGDGPDRVVMCAPQ